MQKLRGYFSCECYLRRLLENRCLLIKTCQQNKAERLAMNFVYINFETKTDLSLWRLEVRTGSLSVAELCLGLGCSEPVTALTREGNLSGHCLP